MAQRDPSEPSRLLKDLESIRTLLDESTEAAESASPTGSGPEPGQPATDSTDILLDIPLLQDIIHDAPGLDLSQPLTPVAAADGHPTAPAARSATELPATLPPRPDAPKPNPFLPYDQLARLAEERVQLDRLMAGHVPPPTARQSPRSDSTPMGAREVRLEARLQAEAQLILQEVIDDLIPTIEAELRDRLQEKLQQMVREQLK